MELNDPAVGAEPAARGELGFELHLTPVELDSVVEMLDFLAPVRVHDDQLEPGAGNGRTRLATDELALPLVEKDHKG